MPDQFVNKMRVFTSEKVIVVVEKFFRERALIIKNKNT